RLFSQIQGDDRVRLALSNELKARGFGQPPQQEEAPPAQNAPANSGQRPANGSAAPSHATGNQGKNQQGNASGNTPGDSTGRENMQDRETNKKQPADGRRRDGQENDRNRPGTPRSY